MPGKISTENKLAPNFIQIKRKGISLIRDIHDFFTIRLKVDGDYKIMQSSENEKNVYQVLRDMGYRYVIINNKRVFYLISAKDLVPVQMAEMKSAFISFLEYADLTNIPYAISLKKLTNWYDGKSIINDNKLLIEYFRENLNDEKVNHLKSQLDPAYNQLHEVNLLLDKLKDWGFQRTINRVFSNSIFRPLNPLYFKLVGNNSYLIFDHCNIKYKAVECLDCYLATYENGHLPGHKKPLSVNRIKMCFNLERDYKLIENMLRHDKVAEFSS
jgi:hypothetical protein